MIIEIHPRDKDRILKRFQTLSNKCSHTRETLRESQWSHDEANQVLDTFCFQHDEVLKELVEDYIPVS
jgi:hypothetical protein